MKRQNIPVMLIIAIVLVVALFVTRSPSTGEAGSLISCVDSDNGKNENVIGTVTARVGRGSRVNTVTVTDTCQNTNTLIEYYCMSNARTQASMACIDGCSSGACIPTASGAGAGTVLQDTLSGTVTSVSFDQHNPLARSRGSQFMNLFGGATAYLTVTYLLERQDSDPGAEGKYQYTTVPYGIGMRLERTVNGMGQGGEITLDPRTGDKFTMIVHDSTDGDSITVQQSASDFFDVWGRFNDPHGNLLVAGGPLMFKLADSSGNTLSSSALPHNMAGKWNSMVATADILDAKTRQRLGTINIDLNVAGKTCTDSDNGNDWYHQGLTCTHDAFTPSECSIDLCIGNNVREYSCSDTGIVSTMLPCPNGCINGACRDDTQTDKAYVGTCTDSDGGINTAVAGRTCRTVEGTACQRDYCTGNTLTEGFCGRYGDEYKAIACPNGCDAATAACR